MPVLPITHRPGVHCASTGLRDLAAFHGLDWSEAMCFGLGAGLGLWYLSLPGLSPSRMVHVRSADIEEQFFTRIDIDFRWSEFDDPARSEAALVEVLDAGRPALIQTDIFHLPYYGSRTHFPGHVVVVWGYDAQRRVFTVTDTERPAPLEVGFDDLRRARYFSGGLFESRGRMFAPARLTPPADMAGCLRQALTANSRALLRPSWPGSGLPGLRLWRDDLETWPTLEDGPWCARFAYQVIEKRGTGGGGFRTLYAAFVREAVAWWPELADAAARMASLAEAWSRLADACRAVSEDAAWNLAALAGCLERVSSLETDYHRWIDAWGLKPPHDKESA